MSHRRLTLVVAACISVAACERSSAREAEELAERSRALRAARLAHREALGVPAPGSPEAEVAVQEAEEKDVDAAAAVHQAQDDSLARTVQSLESMFGAVAALRDSTERSLRADSGTPRADSTLLRFRGLHEVMLRPASEYDEGERLARDLAAPEWQPVLNPDGPLAQRLRSGIAEGDRAASDSAARILSDSVARLLRSYLVRVRIDEGEASVHTGDDAILDRFGRFATEPLRTYLRLAAAEQQNAVASGGAFRLPWDSLTQRMVAAERLLALHPRLAAAPQVEEQLSLYLLMLLADWPDVAAFNGKARTLVPAARARYEHYAAANAGSRSGAAVREYLDLLAAAGNRESATTKAFRDRFRPDRPGFAATGSSASAAASTSFREPPEHVEPNACAGELCGKIDGEQITVVTTVLYERPDTTSRVLARLAPRTRLTVLGSELHTRPAPFVVRRAFNGYLPGDTLWILNSHGEEMFTFRYRSQVSVFKPLRFAGSGFDTKLPLCADPKCWGQLMAPLRIASWFRFRTESGVEGWAQPIGMDGGPSPER